MDTKLIANYVNGNYTIELYNDGTKIKNSEYDFFNANFPDSIDLKITNYCDANCPMCHENSNIQGIHADLDSKFFNTLTKGTELAIGGGNPLSHPDLITFLTKLKNQGIICNITINEKHLLQKFDFVQKLINEKLVWGVGISTTNINKSIIEFAKRNTNCVIHTICGLISISTLKFLAENNMKILILGYKTVGRGKTFYSQSVAKNIILLKNFISKSLKIFPTICFDNLALEQLNIRNIIGENAFNEMFMGKDGESSMYIDLVKKEFAVSSTSSIRYNLEDDIIVMFNKVKECSNNI